MVPFVWYLSPYIVASRGELRLTEKLYARCNTRNFTVHLQQTRLSAGLAMIPCTFEETPVFVLLSE